MKQMIKTAAALCATVVIASAQSDYKVIAEATELLTQQAISQETRLNNIQKTLDSMRGLENNITVLKEEDKQIRHKMGDLGTTLSTRIDSIGRNHGRKIGELETQITKLGDKINDQDSTVIPFVDMNTSNLEINASKSTPSSQPCLCEGYQNSLNKLKIQHDKDIEALFERIAKLEQRTAKSTAEKTPKVSGNDATLKRLEAQRRKLQEINAIPKTAEVGSDK